MSTQQIFGAIGFVVGAYFGYPQLGFVVGSLVGGALTPKTKTEGPRLDDLRVTVSTYGAGIPQINGNGRAGGNVIWSTPKLEVATTTEQGKGGGVENTSYRYYIHMAIGLCESPPPGQTVALRKMWVDGKLQWDSSSGIPVGSALASAENLFAGVTLFDGNEDQLPVSVMEAWEGGPGSVPAYRGIVMAFLVAIECPGGRVPQISVEVCMNPTVGPEVTQFIPSPGYSDSTTGALIHASSIWEWSTTYNGVSNPLTLNISYGVIGAMSPVGRMDLAQGGFTPYPVAGTDSKIIAPFPDGSLQLIDLQDRTNYAEFFAGGTGGPGTNYGRAAYDDSVGLYVVSNYDPTATTGHEPVIVTPGGLATPCDPLGGDGHGPILGFFGGLVHAVVSDGTHPVYVRRLQDGTASLLYPDITGPTIPYSSRWSAMFVDSSGVYVFAVDAAGGSLGIYQVDTTAGTWELLCASPGVAPASISNTVSSSFWCSSTTAITGPSLVGLNYGYNLIRFASILSTEAQVNDIISRQCLKSGLPADHFDVTDIPDTDTVHGYTITNPGSARDNIQPLLTAFAIASREEDRMLKFFKLAEVVSLVTVAYRELGTTEDGQEPGDPFPMSRAQDADLPSSVAISYINPDADYQTGTEKYSRQVTTSQNDQTIDLAIATDADHVMSVAQMICLNAYGERNKFSCKVSRKYSVYSAGDGVTIEYPEGSFGLYRLLTTKDTGISVEWECVLADAELFTLTAVGATGYVGQTVDPLAPATRMLLLDSPIFRDVDNNAGLYVAAEGFGPGWRGYTLFVGDDDTNLQDRGTVTTSSPIGFAESALPDWLPNMLDVRNTVVLNMGDDDELNSTTEALLMTTRVNLALIGNDGRWEAIQFMTAVDLGSNRFLISGMLRGLFGTERFRGTHASGDQFVLLSTAGMLRPSQDAGSLGQLRSYRPVSLGRSLQSVGSVQFANHGVGLLPYSPWDARKSKAASNDQTLTWQRRTRLSSNSLRGIIPLGEATEAYRLDFYTSSAFTTLAGTLASTTRSLTITSAQQSAFGLTPGATLYVHIAQLSDVVGAGPALEATL